MKKLLILLLFFMTGCSVITATPPPTTTPAPTNTPSLPPLRTETVERNIGFVIALEFAPDGRLFYAEQDGIVSVKSVTSDEPSHEILKLDVARGQESGLVGLTLSPDFADTHHFYVYYHVPDADGNPIMGRIVRYTEQENTAVEETIIVDSLPARPDQFWHFGGGLSFGPDGKLYLIFGDTNVLKEARDYNTLPGSILRYNPDGTIPDDNPFPNSPVYAYGVRNGVGLAWHPETGVMYETENGNQCDDEINLITPGSDYGWGLHEYDTCPYPDNQGMEPIAQWMDVIAPAGIMVYTGDIMPELKGSLLVCSYNNLDIYRLELSQDTRRVQDISIVDVPDLDYTCRVDIVQGPDEWIYITTDSTLHRFGR